MPTDDEKNLTRKQRLLLAGERLRVHHSRCVRCRRGLKCATDNVLWERAVKVGLEVLEYCRWYYRSQGKSQADLVDRIGSYMRPLLGAMSEADRKKSG